MYTYDILIFEAGVLHLFHNFINVKNVKFLKLLFSGNQV